MHIGAIRAFIQANSQVVTEELTTSGINREIVKPGTKNSTKPYINKYLEMTDPDTGIPFVSTATVFVSHAWKYKFYDVVFQVMEQHASRNPSAYFWFDLFTNDQNSVTEKDFDWFSRTFKNGIREIGQMLLVLSPWDDPLPLKRAWCLFEIHNALEESQVSLSIDLPDSEAAELKERVIENPGCVLQALSDIKAENSEATSVSDRDLIFRTVKQAVGEFFSVNQGVKNELRTWYVNKLKNLVKEEPENPQLLASSGNVMYGFAFYDDAMSHYNHAMNIYLATEGEKSLHTAMQYHNMACVYDSKSLLERAMEYHNMSLAIRLEICGIDHPDIALSYQGIANVCLARGEHDDALAYLHKSLDIKNREFSTTGEPTVGLAKLYHVMANVYQNKSDLLIALDYYMKSLTIYLDRLGDNHPNLASSYTGIANVYYEQGNLDKALEYYNKSAEIQLSTLGENNPEVAPTFNNMAAVHYQRRDTDKALEFYTKCVAIKRQCFGEQHPSIADAFYNLQLLYKSMGNLEQAAEYTRKADDIRQKMSS